MHLLKERVRSLRSQTDTHTRLLIKFDQINKSSISSTLTQNNTVSERQLKT